jgi:hypothetical protein
MPTENPLSEARYREINTSLGDILRVKELMNKAEACGIDVSADRAYFEAQEANLQAFKREFFPTRN